jgi:hypothetical protein
MLLSKSVAATPSKSFLTGCIPRQAYRLTTGRGPQARITALFDKTMTSARRQGKIAPAAGRAAALLLAGCAAASTGGRPAIAATTEWIVTDPRTGLAIDGFDPVSYFIDSVAMPGRPEFEFRHGGAIWRFRNSGDQAAFIDHPEDYQPRFGGYDPIAIGRGAPTPGNPQSGSSPGRNCIFFTATRHATNFAPIPAGGPWQPRPGGRTC